MDPDHMPQVERDKTDESLRTERKNTDDALGQARTAVENTADQIVAHAREQADAVLDVAREKADHQTGSDGNQPSSAVSLERGHADDVLRGERAAADESLERAREEPARILRELLPFERESTDRHLLIERARSDDSVAHRDDFLGMVSHDLRNLLGSMALNVQLLGVQASNTDEGKRTLEATERLERYIARMNRIVGDLVDVVSIDSGKLTVLPRPCNAADLMTEAVDAFVRSAQKHGVSLAFESDQQSLPAALDHDRMFQVLANLIANAIKFTAAGGVIKVQAKAVGSDLHISVIDNGKGIPADRLDAVFERFWQVGKNDHRGLGLGLYISRSIVEAHGGRLWAESSPGMGSAFHCTIPAALEAAA